MSKQGGFSELLAGELLETDDTFASFARGKRKEYANLEVARFRRYTRFAEEQQYLAASSRSQSFFTSSPPVAAQEWPPFEWQRKTSTFAGPSCVILRTYFDEIFCQILPFLRRDLQSRTPGEILRYIIDSCFSAFLSLCPLTHPPSFVQPGRDVRVSLKNYWRQCQGPMLWLV